MKRISSMTLTAALGCFAATSAGAQIARTRSPEGGVTPGANGVPRDPRFPYVGDWRGTRTMPQHTGAVGFRFAITDGKYSGASIYPDGGTVPHRNLVATAAGLSWEQPNSGGGTWVYTVRLAGPDSMVGGMVLRDPPANLMPAPTATMVLTRQLPPATRK